MLTDLLVVHLTKNHTGNKLTEVGHRKKFIDEIEVNLGLTVFMV